MNKNRNKIHVRRVVLVPCPCLGEAVTTRVLGREEKRTIP